MIASRRRRNEESYSPINPDRRGTACYWSDGRSAAARADLWNRIPERSIAFRKRGSH
jgi:hypothetical protein